MSIQNLILAITLIALFVFKERLRERTQYRRKYTRKTYKNASHQPNLIVKRPEERKYQYKPSEEEIYDASQANLQENQNPVKWDKAFLKSLEWKRYEEVCMEYLKIRNCAAEVTCNGADGGVDIKIHDKDGALFAVAQCKSWSKPIGVALIRELYGVMASDKVKYGIFLTTSIFSPDAIEFAKGKSLILIDADEFIKLINELNEEDRLKLSKIATEGDYTTPTCVKCNVKMVKRTVKNGQHAGNEFWGCVNYPRCKHKMFVRA